MSRCLPYLLDFGDANLPDIRGIGITDADLIPRVSSYADK